MSERRTDSRFIRRKFRLAIAAFIAAAAMSPTSSRADTYTPPSGLLEGFTRSFRADATFHIHLSVELEPRDKELDALALAAVDDRSPIHRVTMTPAAFADRFGRAPAEIARLVDWLRRSGATNVYATRDRLVVGGDLSTGAAERALHTRFDQWARGDRTITAPTTPLDVPATHIRSVRGTIRDFTPRLEIDRPTLPSDLRGAWYGLGRFREAYDAIPNGGAGARIALIEDSSDRADPRDFAAFARGDEALGSQSTDTARASLDASQITTTEVTAETSEQVCGRGDRGQEPTLDVDAALALAPAAAIEVRYDEVCIRGGDGSLELERALDAEPAPTVIVFPFGVAPLYGPLRDAYGPVPVAYLQAALRGIPIVVPAGDDGAYGIRLGGIERAAVIYPCVLPEVICAGGTQLGERNGSFDEGPWNDGTHATGGGIAVAEPRPRWQQAPMDFGLDHNVHTRMAPDLAADASGHLYVYWHGYGSGGVGGTSESAAIVGAQIAAVDAAVPSARRIVSAADLYALAREHPEAFRTVAHANDRNFGDNTLHPAPRPVPLGFSGRLPSPPPTIIGCAPVRPRGCDVAPGYNLVAGLGSLRERTAATALGMTSNLGL